MIVYIALGVDDDCFEGVSPRSYISGGDRVTWKVLAKYSWSPTTTRSCSFLCTVASSTPIRVVTREVRYIHEPSLTLEYSMPIRSPAAPGLTHAIFILLVSKDPLGFYDILFGSFY